MAHRATTAAPAVGSESGLAELVVVKVTPFNAEAALPNLDTDVTPNDAFYVRSNFPVPALSAEAHAITVDGEVQQAISISVAELQKLSQRTITTTMECAGNNRLGLAPLPSGEPWGGGAVSTGIWRGVSLAEVLNRAGLKPSAQEVLVEGADHGKPKDGPGDIPFARSLPPAKALHPDTLLALDMNGEPLPAAHGGPVRLVVPGWYGMASVKWVARIRAIAEPFGGYYQANRYIYDPGDGSKPVPVTAMRVKSVIVSPAEGETVPAGTMVVKGKAWSGYGEIVKVEVTVDGGENWQEARLTSRSTVYAWCAWEFDWPAADPGRHALRARATDSAGQVQPAAAAWNKYGYGNNGARPHVVNVR